MSALRGQMTMRATVQRNTTATDAWGQPGKPGWEDVADVPCYATPVTRAAREILGGSGDQEIVALNDLHVYMPPGTDVTTSDRILQIKDRAGTELYPGPMDIKAVNRFPGRMLDLTVRAAA